MEGGRFGKARFGQSQRGVMLIYDSVSVPGSSYTFVKKRKNEWRCCGCRKIVEQAGGGTPSCLKVDEQGKFCSVSASNLS